MPWKKLLADGRLKKHTTSPEEIADLFRIVDRDLADAMIPQLSSDRRFITAYNAILQLATIALHAAGYRTASSGHHRTTLRALPEILDPEVKDLAGYFDACRRKRNVTDYDRAGEISDAETEEIVNAAKEFRKTVLEWLEEGHPELATGLDR